MDTIIVVDDNKGVREYMSDVFSRAGYDVRLFSDLQCITLELRGGRIPQRAVAFLDGCLSENGSSLTSGINLVDEFRRLAPTTYLIGISGHSQRSPHFRPDHFMQKPFDSETLKRVAEEGFSITASKEDYNSG